DIGLGKTFHVDSFTLNYDVASFHFGKGTLTFLAPVNGVVTGAIFIGEGHFSLKPFLNVDAQELDRRTGSKELEENFNQVVLRFTRSGRLLLLPAIKEETAPSAEVAEVFSHWREKMRQRREQPVSLTDYLLHGETMDNVDADVLSAIYNDAHPEFFNAYIRGEKHNDLRFFVRMRVGALPQLDSPEEVALINYDPQGMSDGVWYLSHIKTEYENRTASSREDRRLFATHSYQIETVIAKNGHLFSSASIRFEPLLSGERILKFGLLPNLRVSRVLDEQGQNLHFVQEGRKEDGSFYVILPQAPPMGKEQV